VHWCRYNCFNKSKNALRVKSIRCKIKTAPVFRMLLGSHDFDFANIMFSDHLIKILKALSHTAVKNYKIDFTPQYNNKYVFLLYTQVSINSIYWKKYYAPEYNQLMKDYKSNLSDHFVNLVVVRFLQTFISHSLETGLFGTVTSAPPLSSLPLSSPVAFCASHLKKYSKLEQKKDNFF